MMWVKQFFSSKLVTVIACILIALHVVVNSWTIINGDLFYNEDIARDLLLLENTVDRQPFTLIGPRISVMGGLYHGPAWIYLNLPAYLIGQGNPIFLAIFWQLLYVGLIAITYLVARKIFDHHVGLLSAVLLTVTADIYTYNNSFGAVVVFPIFFYTMWRYVTNLEVKYLISSYFLLGLMIQFQIAFAAPIALSTTLYLLLVLYKRHKLAHAFAVLTICIPLSTYFLFDIRHNFVQASSILSYFTKPTNTFRAEEPVAEFLMDHLALVVKSSSESVAHGSPFLAILTLGLLLYAMYLSAFHKDNIALTYRYFFGLYISFWIITLMYRDGMWPWYYFQFSPVLVIILCSLYRKMNKYLFLCIFTLLYVIGFSTKVTQLPAKSSEFIGKSYYSWKVYEQIAKDIFIDAPELFGYYINEHDSLGYRTRYALHYIQKQSSKVSVENTKKQTTYLIMEPQLDNKWWKESRVIISNDTPYNTIPNSNFIIEKYQLTSEDMSIPSDPNLVNSLFFR